MTLFVSFMANETLLRIIYFNFYIIGTLYKLIIAINLKFLQHLPTIKRLKPFLIPTVH